MTLREDYDQACRTYLSLCFALAARIERGEPDAIMKVRQAADKIADARRRMVH